MVTATSPSETVFASDWSRSLKLLIHVGTEKTGSSYLQKLCGKNRRFLRDCGFWFPTAGRHERRLQRGTISPGNADELAGYIRDLNWAKVSSWLLARVEEAQERGCKSLLLSNELLFAALSNSGAVNRFQSAAMRAGINELSSLLMIRDPIGQALSLYKHRAKSGTAGNVEEWLATGYFLPKQLSDFLGQIDHSDIQLHLRKYAKESGSVLSVFFHDWLGVETPPVRIENRVNPSLSLSELAVIRHVVATRPKDHCAFYSNFQSVSVDKKAGDGSVERLATAHVESYLCQFNEFWKELDARLASDGGLNVPQKVNFVDVSVPEYIFSEAQLRGWMNAHAESSSRRYAVHWWVNSNLRPRIGKLIRRFVPRFRQG